MIGDFDPIYSTNNIWLDEEFDQCLTLHLEKMKADIVALQNKVTVLENALNSNEYLIVNATNN